MIEYRDDDLRERARRLARELNKSAARGDPATQKNRLWVNEARTVLVTQYPDGTKHVALRDDPSHTWGPPVEVKEEV